AWLSLAGALLALCVLAPGAGAGPTDPSIHTPKPPSSPFELPEVPPSGYLEGPCGLASGPGGLYVSDYYHHTVDVFDGGEQVTQLKAEDPLDGPCALAFDSSENLYVNNYHRNVARFSPYPTFSPDSIVASELHPTGLAIDAASDDLYVDARTYIARYEGPVEAGDEPLQRIGEGSLGDGYGLARSAYPATAGRLYVPDAETNTIKVYDPALSTAVPVQEIAGPSGGFTSLRDSAIAVDDASGKIYVVDNLQPAYAERPQAQIDVFSPAGAYEGHLKYLITDALPPGLDANGSVYVTSGNTIEASIYAYGPAAATTAPPICQKGAVCPAGATSVGQASGAGAPESASRSASAESQGEPRASQPGAHSSAIAQKGSLRLSVNGKLSPRKLPRKGSAPISVSVGWKVASADGSAVPKLKALSVQINRHGRFDAAGLPTCPYARIQPASSQRALANCRSALVGKGSFEADISLRGQEPYSTKGKLLVFNGLSHGKQVLFGQIYSPYPFATSFVIVFAVKSGGKGPYGTTLSATLPKALASWGNLTGIQMTLSRRYGYGGRAGK
ncbi:MAG: hypothetical protein ACRDLL_10910, partial [Solirubrobacterales bacterium]